MLTVTNPFIWHGSGTSLSRRQSTTRVGTPTDSARVPLAAHAPPSAALTLSSTKASRDGPHLTMAVYGRTVTSASHGFWRAAYVREDVEEMAPDGLDDDQAAGKQCLSS